MKGNLLMAAVVLLMAAGLKTTAQPNLQWVKNYGGVNTDKAYAIKQLPDNGYIVVGETNSGSGDVTGFHGGIDYWVARLDAAGNIVWQKTYGGSHNDIAVSVDLTNDGGFIIAGSSDSQDGDVTDHPNGEVESEGGAGGGGGPVIYPAYPDVHTWIVKIDGAGNINWTKTFAFSLFRVPDNGGPIHVSRYPINRPGKIIHTSDDGYLLALKKEVVPGDPLYPMFYGYESIPYLVKLSNTGDVVWTNDFPNLQPEDFGVKALLEISDGYIFVASPFDFETSGSYDLNVVKINFSGIVQNSRKYGGSGTDVGVSISATTDGGYIITGRSDSYDNDLASATYHGGADYWVLKLNSALDVQWSKLYGGSQDDIPSAVIQAPDGNYIVAGTSISDDQQVLGHTPSAAGQPANSDIWLIKINGSNGDLIWSASYGGDKDDTGNDLVKTTDGGLIVAGSSFSSFGNIINKGEADWLLLKLNECNSTPPASPADQHFCSNTNPVVDNLKASGQDIKWYDIPTGGRPLPLTKPLSAAGAYYVSQNTGSCESARQKVRVRVFTTPEKPVASAQRFLCSTKPRVCNLVATGKSLKWYSSIASTEILAPGTALHTGIYYVTQTVAGLCESERTAVCVTVVGSCNCVAGKMQNDITDAGFDLKEAIIYPNPNKGMFKLNIPAVAKTGSMQVQVTDMYGKIVMQKQCTVVKGAVQETISVSNLAAAVYFVKYENGGRIYSTRMVVEK